MNLESKKRIKELTSKLLTQTLLTQSIINLLIDKGVCTSEEIDDTLRDSIIAMEDTVIENSDLIFNINSFLEDDFDSKKELEEESVMSKMYYGPLGEA
jgi:hypothetical protein|tara:strand:+ start:203 stop:496 length:294 start_codon:yes stop_codon:yes gene_type:complete